MFPAHVEPFVEKNSRTVMFSVHTKQAIACTIDSARGLNEKSCKTDLLEKKKTKKKKRREDLSTRYLHVSQIEVFKKCIKKINISFHG